MTTKPMDQVAASYRRLGRSGLRVSNICLGTMTFGTESGWGTDKETARTIFDRYVAVGGNFFDTADAYTNGRSEEWLGDFIRERNLRDYSVIATKFTYDAKHGDPNAGGNSRKAILRAVENSLKRLKTDYIDLYWLHTWDKLTTAEEVMKTLSDLTRQGKIRYIGLSNVPAWYAARAQTLAEWLGLERVAALQLEYSLVSRSLEREHAPMTTELGLGICVWSPLAGGFLSGKYQRGDGVLQGKGRISTSQNSGNPVLEKFSKDERNWQILDTLTSISKEIGRPPAEVALNWVVNKSFVTSVLIGATKLKQLDTNLSSLTFQLPQELQARLDLASHLPPNELDHFFGSEVQTWIRGGTFISS